MFDHCHSFIRLFARSFENFWKDISRRLDRFHPKIAKVELSSRLFGCLKFLSIYLGTKSKDFDKGLTSYSHIRILVRCLPNLRKILPKSFPIPNQDPLQLAEGKRNCSHENKLQQILLLVTVLEFQVEAQSYQQCFPNQVSNTICFSIVFGL